ncbi:MAG: DUF3382 domain-containing protein, partial [Comamonas sp.]
MKTRIKDSIIAAILAGLVVLPIFGLQLQRRGGRNFLEPHWNYVIGAIVIVFLFQLVKPLFASRLKQGWLPALPQVQPGGQRALMLLVLLAAVIWPFFSGRNAVDIATLALIYVMLGLGLNIVVGLAGLLDLGYV